MKNEIKVLVILVVMFILLFLNSFTFNFLNKFTMLLFVSFASVLSIYLFGFRKDFNNDYSDIILSIIIYVCSYYIIIFLLGLLLGFNKNIIDSSFLGIIFNVFITFFMIVSTEIFRYSVSKRFSENKFILLFLCIVLFLVDSSFILKDTFTNDFDTFLFNFGFYILPFFITNIVMMYFSVKWGYKICSFYRMLLELPLVFLPILPAFGNYIWSTIRIAIPVIIFVRLYLKYSVKKDNKIICSKSLYSSKYKFVFESVMVVIMVILIYLTSGLFKYKLIVVASNSMSPNIRRGDVVLIKKIEISDASKLEIDNVILFKTNDKLVVHRIYKIMDSSTDLYYQTKGDSNKTPDNFLLSPDEVIGITCFKIKYIGYPSLWLSDLIG